MDATTGQRLGSTRERFREHMRDDIKGIALTQLATGGAQAISLNAIAKELGLSGSALYRYYTNRDDLLNALVVDAYTDLRDALAADAARTPAGTGTEARIRGLARTYREWARTEPPRYELLFKPPLPGYDAHAEPLAEAARSLMVVVLSTLAEQPEGGRPDADQPDGEHRITPPSGNDVLSARRGATQEFLEGVRMWSRFHGLVSLEIGGSFNAMNVDADALFEFEVIALAGELGARAPQSVTGSAQ